MSAGRVAFDFEATFRTQYDRIARVIARVVRDPARSEELAVEVFLKLWRTPAAQGEHQHGSTQDERETAEGVGAADALGRPGPGCEASAGGRN